MKQKVAPQSRKNDIVVQDLNGEVLIYDLKSNKAFCLNETSALVWQACDGTKSVSEISQAISKKLNEPANEDLVWLALDQLKQENLLENNEEITSNFNGMSRREVIRKVGLGTMIALPLISGLIAPTAAMAQSRSACMEGTACACSVENGDTTSARTCEGDLGGTIVAGCGEGGFGRPAGCDCEIPAANGVPDNNNGTCVFT